jgi:hypothetical protein
LNEKIWPIKEVAVSAAIAVAVGMIVVPMTKNIRYERRVSTTLDNMRLIYTALSEYQEEYEGTPIGSFAKVGLPPSQVVSSTWLGLGSERFRCGCGRNREWMPAEAASTLVYDAARYERTDVMLGPKTVLFFSMNCNPESSPLYSFHFPHRGLGVNLEGGLLNVYREGDWSDPSWWSKSN